MKTFFRIFLPSLILFAACKKDSSSGGQQSGTTLTRIVEGTDPNLANDTVYLISYNSGRISSVLDSLYQDSLVATYDASGRLTEVDDIGPYSLGSATFSYDANGLLTQILSNVAGSTDKFVFEYTNGVLSKKSDYTDAGGGSFQLWNYDVYTFNNGDITDMKEYNSAGALTFEATYSYGSQANPFKNLSLFNFGNRLGTDDIINFDTYFNKDIRTGFSISGLNSTSTNTFNSRQKPTKIVFNDQLNQWLLTWQFFYQ
ncbi:MAG TPA: hypothetical protein VKT28_21475 [Puia sp.]|nr:hypothetical protein [Puia sp.]